MTDRPSESAHVAIVNDLDINPGDLLHWLLDSIPALVATNAIWAHGANPTDRSQVEKISEIQRTARATIKDSRNILLAGCLGLNSLYHLLAKLQIYEFHGCLTVCDQNPKSIHVKYPELKTLCPKLESGGIDMNCKIAQAIS